MEVFATQVVLNGRITIPNKIRKKLEINEGDYVRVEITKLELTEANPEEA